MKLNLSAIAIFASVWTVQVTADDDCELPPYTDLIAEYAPDLRDFYCSLPPQIQDLVEFSAEKAIVIDYPLLEFVQTCYGSLLKGLQNYLVGAKTKCTDDQAHIRPMHVVVDPDSESDVSVTTWAPTFCIPDTCKSNSLKTYMGSIYIESNKAFFPSPHPDSEVNVYKVTESFLPSVECVTNYFRFQRNPQAVCTNSARKCADISFYGVTIASDKSFSQPICMDGCRGKSSKVTETEMNRILELRGNGYSKKNGENPYCVSEDDSVLVERYKEQPVFDSDSDCTNVKLDKRLGRCYKCWDDPAENCERLTPLKKKKKLCKNPDVNIPCAITCGRCCHSAGDYKFTRNSKGKKKGCLFIKNSCRKRKYCVGLTKKMCGNECGCKDFT